MPICRLIVLTLLGVLWLWAGSVYSPWAEDLDPRLWLYDFLFYSGYILLFWVLVEAGLRLRSYRDGIASLRALFAGACLLVVSGLAVNLPGWIVDTEIGWRWRVRMSLEALAPYAVPAHADVRHRVGMLLVDTRREPCPGQSWLWLGRPFGGGTGINLALVHGSRNAVPKSPQAEAFRFLHMHKNWWLAYQNPDSYSAETDGTIVCVEGRSVASHEQGLRFIDSRH
ncbi:MAG: hypothetical protein RIQ43_41 [Pseudomonadota bacterium]